MRTLNPASKVAWAIATALAAVPAASAQDATPAAKAEGTVKAPAADPIDKGVPPAKRAGDEGTARTGADARSTPAADGSTRPPSQ